MKPIINSRFIEKNVQNLKFHLLGLFINPYKVTPTQFVTKHRSTKLELQNKILKPQCMYGQYINAFHRKPMLSMGSQLKQILL